MKRVVLTDSGGFTSVVDNRFTGTQWNINMNKKLSQETPNVGFHKVIQQKNATTIERKHKTVRFFLRGSNRFVRYLSSLRSILHDTMSYIQQCWDFYTNRSYSIADNIGFSYKLSILYVYKLDTYMEALCLNAP